MSFRRVCCQYDIGVACNGFFFLNYNQLRLVVWKGNMSYDPEKILAEAVEKYLACFHSGKLGDEKISIFESQGRVLGVDIFASYSVPPFVSSLVDGYAVGSSDTAFISEDGPATLKVAGKVEMGKVPTSLPGVKTAFYIPTGGMLPDGADAVVRLEDTKQKDGDMVEVAASVHSGDNIVLDGVDVVKDQLVLNRGTLIGPDEMAVLAQFGYLMVSVVKRPVIAVFSSGDELLGIDEELKPGCIRDTNGYLIAGMLKEAGAQPVLSGIVKDDMNMLLDSFGKALETADMVLLTGGTAVGGRDFTAEAFDRLGVPGVVLNGIKVKGGRPIVLAAVGKKPVVGLAGYPPGAKSGFGMVVDPLIKYLLGVKG